MTFRSSGVAGAQGFSRRMTFARFERQNSAITRVQLSLHESVSGSVASKTENHRNDIFSLRKNAIAGFHFAWENLFFSYGSWSNQTRRQSWRIRVALALKILSRISNFRRNLFYSALREICRSAKSPTIGEFRFARSSCETSESQKRERDRRTVEYSRSGFPA